MVLGGVCKAASSCHPRSCDYSADDPSPVPELFWREHRLEMEHQNASGIFPETPFVPRVMTCRQARSPQLTGDAPFSARMTAAEYRAKADQCRALAAQCAFPFEKEAWLRMADDWLELAREAEPVDRKPSFAYSAS
jgi:hypothetical protein